MIGINPLHDAKEQKDRKDDGDGGRKRCDRIQKAKLWSPVLKRARLYAAGQATIRANKALLTVTSRLRPSALALLLVSNCWNGNKASFSDHVAVAFGSNNYRLTVSRPEKMRIAISTPQTA